MFLFTVFLIGVKELELSKRYVELWEGRALVGLGMLAVFIAAFSSITPSWKGSYTIEYIEKVGNTKAVGISLFNEYGMAFLLLV